MTAHLFDIDVAARYGIHAAILVQHVKFWIEKNRADDAHAHEGRTWMPASLRRLTSVFPYLSEKQIRSAVDLLVAEGVLVSGNFNSTPYMRTKWYAFADEGKWLNSAIRPGGQKADRIGGNPDLPAAANAAGEGSSICPGGQESSALEGKCNEDDSLDESLNESGSPNGSAGEGQPSAEPVRVVHANDHWKANHQRLFDGFMFRDFDRLVDACTVLSDVDGVLTLGVPADRLREYDETTITRPVTVRNRLAELLERTVMIEAWDRAMAAYHERRAKRLDAGPGRKRA